MTLSRRFVVLAALMFWQGGFTFYVAVVVPVGQEVLASHRRQGFISRRVTNYLNLTGAVALVPLAWDAAVSREGSARRRRLRWAAWGGMALALGMLVWLHGRMDELLDPVRRLVLDPTEFYSWHRGYLWASTVQWGFCLAYMYFTLRAWREEDRERSRPSEPEA
jgi:hypothetical protein